MNDIVIPSIAQTITKRMAEAARALTNIIKADRATRLEFTIVLLIVTGIALILIRTEWRHR